MDNQQCRTGLDLSTIPFIKKIIDNSMYIINGVIDNKMSLVLLIVYILVFYIIYSAIKGYKQRQYIIDNWNDYKCKPYIMPISGLFKNNKGFLRSTFDNFNECNWFTFKTYFGLLIKPITFTIQIITKAIAEITYTINKFRQMAKLLRELFKKMIEQVMEKITTSVSSIQFYTEKFRDLMKKQFAVFQLIYYYLEALRLTFDSFSQGPTPVLLIFLMMFGVLMMFMIVMCGICVAQIPFVSWIVCPICLLCFDKSTLITMFDGSPKTITNISLNDRLKPVIYGENKVIGKLTMQTDLLNQPDMYNYNGIFVTGSHIVYENNKPIRIADSIISKRNFDIIDSIHCLITTQSKFYSGKTIFADYQETTDPMVQSKWNTMVLNTLNGTNNIHLESNMTYYYAGFCPNTIINGKYIKDIKLGDVVDDKVVFGIVEILIDDVDMYLYNGIICSGTNIIYDDVNNWWCYIHQLSDAIKTTIDSSYIIHLMISDGILNIGKYKFRDFMETHDLDNYEQLHDLNLESIETQLNNI